MSGTSPTRWSGDKFNTRNPIIISSQIILYVFFVYLKSPSDMLTMRILTLKQYKAVGFICWVELLKMLRGKKTFRVQCIIREVLFFAII